MSIDTVLAELKSMYRGELAGDNTPNMRLGNSDIERWSAELGMPRATFYDLLALHLARDFHRNELTFSFCDWILNDVHGVITWADEIRPALFWNIFLAFDAGEYYHDDSRGYDPADKYTRPLITQILRTIGDPLG